VATISNKELIARGTVTEALPNTMFRVIIHKNGVRPDMAAEYNVETLAYLGGKMKYNRIRVLVGDEVDLLLDSYGGKAKITRRGK
jgi:translation initiation factor IF-1